MMYYVNEPNLEWFRNYFFLYGLFDFLKSKTFICEVHQDFPRKVYFYC